MKTMKEEIKGKTRFQFHHFLKLMRIIRLVLSRNFNDYSVTPIFTATDYFGPPLSLIIRSAHMSTHAPLKKVQISYALTKKKNP